MLKSATSLNELGDSYGIVNALISGAAFVIIALSLYLQRADLKTQLSVLEHSITEAQGTRKATSALAKQEELSNKLQWLQTTRELDDGINVALAELSRRPAEENTFREHTKIRNLLIQRRLADSFIGIRFDNRSEEGDAQRATELLSIADEIYRRWRSLGPQQELADEVGDFCQVILKDWETTACYQVAARDLLEALSNSPDSPEAFLSNVLLALYPSCRYQSQQFIWES